MARLPDPQTIQEYMVSYSSEKKGTAIRIEIKEGEGQMTENEKRFRIEFTVDAEGWSDESIKHNAIQELTCMVPYPEDITFSEANPWHTGTPTVNDPFYVREVFILQFITPKGDWYFHGHLFKPDFQNKRFRSWVDKNITFAFDCPDLRWQKITPYKEN